MYLDYIQDVVMPVFTAATVTSLVLQTVKTARATYKMERVSPVNLDGLIYIAMKVRPLMIVFFNNIPYQLWIIFY